jgi:nucleotide-binding universal stress UspA family protein
MFKTVIWATDASEAAEAALPFAKELVEESGGRLIVVHSNEILHGRAGGHPVLADEVDLEARIEAEVEELRKEGIDATFKLVSGTAADPAHSIAEVASTFEADVIVIGTRGHGPVVGVVVGSVTQQLLHLAPCPVLAIPPATRWLESTTRARAAATA